MPVISINSVVIYLSVNYAMLTTSNVLYYR